MKNLVIILLFNSLFFLFLLITPESFCQLSNHTFDRFYDLDYISVNKESTLIIPGCTSVNQSEKELLDILLTPINYGYFHITIGGYFWIFRCHDYEYFISPLNYYPVSIIRFIGLNAGFKNIVQFEFRITNDDGNDEYLELPPTLGNLNNREETKMYWKNKEWIFKVNPFFKLLKPRTALFLSYGFSNKLSHYDYGKLKIWDGRSMMFGSEFMWITRAVSGGFFIEYRIVNFEKITLTNVGYTDIDYKGGIFSFGLKVGLGYGH